ncbi:deoxyguanosinetriphosphate triphosphohydrolase [Listeria rustica]|uniref:Deoxyguanosinetriphosphate triphosphohydrolase n=1 Tax=Listeria rustica TaxID=2713503 RepID=A0A7W1T567_9LIST|nr:deoxyguanosinetriphosphate triphosphohydrolase [Listeria rustica]MBA3925670.1 deoxyguanosinetriphosphate triphosphohydrolase [Listeria rustica]
MEWSQLLCKERQRESSSKGTSYYNEFDKDYSRIVYSSSVRRLQDKAQVFPLQENDFTRTRLTHSLEVASLGRSLAWNIGNWLCEENKLKDFWQVKEFVSIVETASLVHDLGNPPFGHYGEDIIRKWFKKWFESSEFESLKSKNLEMSDEEKKDFLYFEGNAQGLRILTKLQILSDEYGANFTYGTLGALTKYPWYSTSEELDPDKPKFGCFQSEKKLFEKIKECTGIGGKRKHPATLLMEAADDIAYLPTDLEDAVKKNAVSWEKIEKAILPKIEKNHFSLYEKLKENLNTLDERKIPEIDLVKMQTLKITIQRILIEEVVETFKNNYDIIMDKGLDGKLIEKSNANYLEEICSELCGEFVFSNKEVLTLELVGDKVITELLTLFVGAIVTIERTDKTKTKEQKLYNLISENFRYAKLFDSGVPYKLEYKDLNLYNRLQLVTDFISGMTDSYAVNLHQQLLGVKMP